MIFWPKINEKKRPQEQKEEMAIKLSVEGRKKVSGRRERRKRKRRG